MIKENNKSANFILTIIVIIGILIIGFLVLYIYNDNYVFYINEDFIEMEMKETYSIKLIAKHPNYQNNKNYIYKSGNENVVTVDKKGKITPIGVGTTEIIIKSKKGFHKEKIKIVIKDISNKEEITKIWFSSETYALKKGNKLELKLITSPNNIKINNIKWSSSNENIATVDSNGMVKGLLLGEVTIIATLDNNIQTSCKIIIQEKEIESTSITLNKQNISLYPGNSETLTATILPENSTNKNVIWTSSDNNIVSISDGVITAQNIGTATITAKLDNGLQATSNITVMEVIPTAITLDNNSIILKIGETETLNATITPENVTNKTIIWESSNNNVVEVKNGKVIAKSLGEATITATLSNGLKATCIVTVQKEKINASSISLNKTTTTINIGSSETLIATILPENTTNKNITWISSDNNIASVSNGIITAKKQGTITITAKTSNGKTAAIKITVNSPSTPAEVCEYIRLNNIDKVLYEDFQKVINNKDDYYAMKEAHDCANRLNLPVYATKDATYNIYKTKAGEESIKVKTSTDFNNATIYIHDETGVIGTNKDRNAIFNIVNNEATIQLDSTKISSLKGKIKKNVKNISELSGYGNILVKVVNDNKKQFIRYGANADSGASQTEVFKVDNNGNVLNDIIWNYNNITSVSVMKIPNNLLTFKNGNFVTIATTSSTAKTKTNYAFRGITVKRSKTTLTNINHTVVNSSKNKISTISYTYYGFIQISSASDITMRNCNLYALKTTNTKPNSTYDFIISNSTNLTIDRVKIPTEQLTGLYWGVIATNYIKDATFSNCKLNRIDSHNGVHNLTISNSTIGDRGLSLIGGGKLKISNTSVSGTKEFIRLREDYGSLWNGTIEITDSTFTPSTSSPSLIYMEVPFDGNLIHNFGYDLVIPNVQVTNFTIKNSTNKFYIYNNSNTGLLNGNLSIANKYTGGKFIFTPPSSIRYSNITSTSGTPSISKYKIHF